MRTALVMMFRDEADILGPCLAHWQAAGIDKFFLCDNGSKDESPDIARQFDRALITDTRTNWPGPEIINQLKNRAINSGYDVVFPVDADEFIELGQYEDIQGWLKAKYPPVYYAAELRYLNVLPNGHEYWQEPHRKVFGCFNPSWTVCAGNHHCNGVTPLMEDHVYYRHYSIRSYPQFRQKMVNYMTAFNQIAGWQDHPHAKSWHRWQREGEQFLEDHYKELTEWPK